MKNRTNVSFPVYYIDLEVYMIAAGRINEEAKNNIWVLYHQIFYKELADTECNSMFLNLEGERKRGR